MKAAIEETILTPRFYTTDFETSASLDLSVQETELEAMLVEMRTDYNRDRFLRDEEFKQSWEHIDIDELCSAIVSLWQINKHTP